MNISFHFHERMHCIYWKFVNLKKFWIKYFKWIGIDKWDLIFLENTLLTKTLNSIYWNLIAGFYLGIYAFLWKAGMYISEVHFFSDIHCNFHGSDRSF